MTYRSYGLMDKASYFGSEDCTCDSCYDQLASATRQPLFAFIITQLAAEPEELEFWEWSCSTAFTTLILLPSLFFATLFVKQQQPR